MSDDKNPINFIIEKMDNQELKDHLKNEHKQNPFAVYIKEFVYEGNDGIVTTFAVVAGFSGANIGDQTLNFSILTVLLFGFANLFADGAAMGLGNYLSLRSEQKVYKDFYQKELSETRTSRDFEIEETELIFREQGFDDKDSKTLTKIISKNIDFWVRFMVLHEGNMKDTENESALYSGLATFVSFIVFGFFPLIPYIFISNSDISYIFFISGIFTFGALVLLGIFRAFIANASYFISILETLVIGGTAATLAYLVGFLFRI